VRPVYLLPYCFVNGPFPNRTRQTRTCGLTLNGGLAVAITNAAPPPTTFARLTCSFVRATRTTRLTLDDTTDWDVNYTFAVTTPGYCHHAGTCGVLRLGWLQQPTILSRFSYMRWWGLLQDRCYYRVPTFQLQVPLTVWTLRTTHLPGRSHWRFTSSRCGFRTFSYPYRFPVPLRAFLASTAVVISPPITRVDASSPTSLHHFAHYACERVRVLVSAWRLRLTHRRH